MPAKKVVSFGSCVEESKETSVKITQEKEASKLPSIPNLLVIIIIIVFSVALSQESFSQMNKKYLVSDDQAKSCMMDFQDKHCNAFNMGDECLKIFKCIQKVSKQEIGIFNQAVILLPILFKLVKEYGFLPASLIVLIFLYQITRATMKEKESEKSASSE